MNVITARILSLTLVVSLTLVIWFVPRSVPASTCDCLLVSFLDVGQGDAIYVRTVDGIEVLIDGGRDATVLRALSPQRSFFDRTIEMVVATHPDLDHIGGLIDVLERYEVGVILTTTNKNDTPAASAFSAATAAENANVIFADASQRFLLGASTTMTIYSPRGDETNWETNNSSVIIRIEYGDTSVLLTGDAYTGVEEHLVKVYGVDLQSNILKLGHHGSKTSTSELFLDTVDPNFAIVSAGVDNRYNHPHQEVMQRVFARNIKTFHTGTDGTITFVSDGKSIVRQ